MPKLAVIVQCAKVTERCCGYPCMRHFYARDGMFKDYPEDARYMTLDCGGCCGIGLAAKLENFQHKLNKFKEYNKDEDVTIHLASCIVSDNYHNPPCPFRSYMREIIERKGFKVVLGSYISKATSAGRESGKYKPFSA